VTGRSTHPRRDDQGGVWIATGIALAVLMYGFIVVLAVAGFTEVLPLVILPPVVLGLIAANNLIGGGRTPGRPAPRAAGPASAPRPTGVTGGPADTTAAPAGPARAEEQPPGP
jgi:hypothetical protein